MKNTFKFYALMWAVGFAIFNLVTFLPVTGIEVVEISSPFIVSYIFCDILFIAQLGCGYFAFKEENLQKVFYNIPLVRTSFVSLIVTIAVSVVLSLIPGVPDWLTVLVLAVITLISVILILKANFVSEEVSKIDEKIKSDTFFIKSLTVDVETLISKATTEEAKAQIKKVYEAVRYSDPMSHSALASLESELTIKFNTFAEATKAGNLNETLANEILILIEERNKKCKLLK